MDNQARVRQSMSESAHRRQMYQKLLETGSGINDSLEEEDLLKTLAKVNKLTRDGNEMFGDQKENEEPRQASEVVMDIQVLKMSNEIVSKSMKSKGMTDFYDDEFVNAIKELIVDANQQWSWQKLVPIWGKRMKQGSFYGYTLLGSFGEIVKKKEEAVPKQRAKRAKNTVVEEKKPENVAKLKQETKSSQRINDVYRQVLRIFDARQRKPIPFFELVCDPNCFMTTIDNIFQVSFLCREGILAITDDDNDMGYPTVLPQKKGGNSQIVKDTTQSVSTINYVFWQQCISKYNIRKALLQDTKTSRTSEPSTSK